MTTYRQPFRNEWPITQNYGDTITSVFHTGIDYGCPFGTSILASSEGTVMFAAWDTTGYGNTVIIRHTDKCSTLYAHLSDISVKYGQKVRQGELIGHSGSTGNSTGPHLHFEARTVWNDYKTHFDPIKLPLISVDDNAANNGKGDGKLFGADKLNSDVFVSAPSGVFGHSEDFSSKKVFPYGSKLIFTGNTVEHNGLTFCECIDTVWIAVHDNETQLLNNL